VQKKINTHLPLSRIYKASLNSRMLAITHDICEHCCKCRGTTHCVQHLYHFIRLWCVILNVYKEFPKARWINFRALPIDLYTLHRCNYHKACYHFMFFRKLVFKRNEKLSQYTILVLLLYMLTDNIKVSYIRFEATAASCFHKPPAWCPDIIMSDC